MFDVLFELFKTDPLRAYVVSTGIFVILALMIWISVIDIKKKTVTFWKMLVASSSTIIIPIIGSFFCGCYLLKYFLLASLIIWIAFLYFNIKFNNEKIVGKADIDLMSAIISEMLCVSAWIWYVGAKYMTIKITEIWYSMFLYLLLGSLILIVFVFLSVILKSIFFRDFDYILKLKGSKISMIPMFIPVAVMIPYLIMVL